MGKIWIEVCLISARGLRRSSSLWKLQWYGVGWIDPKDKYCTNIDASGNANPVWNTKFATCIDDLESKINDLESKINDLELHVEVYSRDPIFLREKLQGTATIILKEFLAKFKNNSGVSRSGTEEVGSYQLRKRNSNKPQGFIDVSIRISQDREEPTSYLGNGEEMDLSSTITLATRDGSAQDYPAQLPLATFHRPQNQTQPNSPYAHPMPFPTNYSNPSAIGPSYPPAYGPSYQPPRTPPPPPLRSNVGYVPAFLQNSETYINMPPSGAGRGLGRGGGTGFGMGVGAGALAAGAVMFGDDFMSGFDVPSGFQDPNIVVSLDPPF